MKEGDVLLVRVRVVNPCFDQGSILCVADSFEGDIHKEQEATFLMAPMDVAGKGVHQPCPLEAFEV